MMPILIGLLMLGPSDQTPGRALAGEDSSLKPAYRELKPGEQRVEGLLRRIDCPGGKPVLFTMNVKDRIARFQAPRLGSVDFIAHRPGFKGPVSCGGFTPPEHVYLTWKPIGKVETVIAVEFLPAK
jgi:hypothetical protein